MTAPISPDARQVKMAAYFTRQAEGARAELCRADVKANTLLTVNGTMFSVLTALAVLVGHDLPAGGVLGVCLTVAALGTSTVMLLLTILPTLPGRGEGVGFPVLAGYLPDQVKELCESPPVDLEEEQGAEAIRLSNIAYDKHVRVQAATRLLIAALVMLGVTAIALIVWK
ncbi:Pycsar system effector family protein [Nonomuraea guangzhouensis]|uniref:Pycsar system effector family protein n=1 Tax=Nonomuraea guangzhouensis TaxID=1291555 RepID=A0ABW4GXY9_9ACTN|nr:Pycsar system effector family protein [Nonomuraea guangzhouensis]